jgi:hypothetical protein
VVVLNIMLVAAEVDLGHQYQALEEPVEKVVVQQV